MIDANEPVLAGSFCILRQLVTMKLLLEVTIVDKLKLAMSLVLGMRSRSV